MNIFKNKTVIFKGNDMNIKTGHSFCQAYFMCVIKGFLESFNLLFQK